MITGVGYRESAPGHDKGNVFSSPGIKPNIGAAVALEAARRGYRVALLARSADKLLGVADSIKILVPGATLTTHPVDLRDADAVRTLATQIFPGVPLDLVHSAGLSAGSYGLSENNPYTAIENTPPEMPLLEFDAVVRTLLTATQAFLPRWRSQPGARLVVVSSMSGIRPFPYGFSHCSAKGGLHLAVRCLTHELNGHGVQVSEVLPGIVNTGFYDDAAVTESVTKIGHSFGYDFQGGLPQMEPQAVADAVLLCLTASAHVLTIPMVAQGQFPHLSA